MTTPPDHDKPRRANISAMNPWRIRAEEDDRAAMAEQDKRTGRVVAVEPITDLTTLVQRLERAVERLEALAAVKVPGETKAAPAGNVGDLCIRCGRSARAPKATLCDPCGREACASPRPDDAPAPPLPLSPGDVGARGFRWTKI